MPETNVKDSSSFQSRSVHGSCPSGWRRAGRKVCAVASAWHGGLGAGRGPQSLEEAMAAARTRKVNLIVTNPQSTGKEDVEFLQKDHAGSARAPA